MRFRRDLPAGRGPEPAAWPWLGWLQQITTLVYLIAGLFLIYQYWRRLHRQVVLAAGILFVAYSIYRFFLVRRTLRKSR
jgi:uncharacterized membrane protein YozB (DUF420 family)